MTLASGLTLSIATQGDGRDPPLVLLPGPTDSWRSYRLVLEALSTSVRAVAVSQRGHGQSDKPAAGYGLEDFAADVVPLLDALEIERAVLAGHSGSCLTIRRVALDHPERVAGLVLEASPTTLRGDAGLRAFIESFVAEVSDPISPEVARDFVIDTSSASLPSALIDDLVAELQLVPARVWHEMFGALLDYDDMHELHRITAPALLVWGDGDRIVPSTMQEELLRRLPNAELRVHAGAGHTPRWDDPTRFAGDLADFVARRANP